MDPGWDPIEGFFSELIVISAVNIISVLSDPVPFYTVVQHWHLSINRDHVAVGFVIESPSMLKIIFIQMLVGIKTCLPID